MKLAKLSESYRLRVTTAFFACIFTVVALGVFFLFQYGLKAQLEQLREELKAIADTASLQVDAEAFQAVPLNAEGINSDAYKKVAAVLARIKHRNPNIFYIYTMAKTNETGILQFVVDPDPVVTVRRKANLTSFPGDRYNARAIPEMMRAFYGASADRAIISDAWGPTLSGYAPIKDPKTEKTIGILGVDYSAKRVLLTKLHVYYGALIMLLFGFIISLILGYFVAQGVTKPVAELVKGTKHLADGDLKYHVAEGKGKDEISQLANRFNYMAGKLLLSQQELENYFYRVAQSFIRMLEAVDRYTSGHSDRVGEHSRAIALRMGLPEHKADLLKEIAQLHDIGKLAVNGAILNKPGRLTDEEWEEIRKHPLMGEDVLRPVILDEQMLKVIRHHHEHYDGTGYPDGLKGEEIDLLAQIVSAADAFDAMTSLRSYHAPLSGDEAMAELRRVSGTQLNPDVVRTFCTILEEEALLKK